MENMELFKKDGSWVCKTDSPRTIAIMGTATLPTPFRDSVDGAFVLAKIRKLNPDANVVLI